MKCIDCKYATRVKVNVGCILVCKNEKSSEYENQVAANHCMCGCTVDDIRSDVCKKCGCYDKLAEVCRREVLPIDRAILTNAEGRGSCDEVKEYIKERSE